MAHTSFQKQNLAQQVADKLSQTIDQRGWTAGKRLPAVRDLARQFNVSPNTAHSAIRILARKGMVDMRPRGSFMRGKGADVSESGKRVQIGIILPSRPDPDFQLDQDNWTGRILQAAQLALHEAGYYTTILGYAESPDFTKGMEPMRPHLAGVLTFARSFLQPLLEMLDQWDMPWITINSLKRDSVHNFVAADNHGDCVRLGQRLAKSGLSRICVLTTGLSTPVASSMEKLLGLYEGFATAGVSSQQINVIDCDDTRESTGYEAMRRRLEQSPRPRLVFAHGDLLALGAIRACRERGVRVPEEIGVIGATGLHLSGLSHPSLSVVRQPMEEMGRQAAQMLAEMSRDGTRRLIGRRISGQFIERESFIFPCEQMLESSNSDPLSDRAAPTPSNAGFNPDPASHI